jgi:hypothetical protein
MPLLALWEIFGAQFWKLSKDAINTAEETLSQINTK